MDQGACPKAALEDSSGSRSYSTSHGDPQLGQTVASPSPLCQLSHAEHLSFQGTF
jgi:hypothetical protein